MDIRSFFKKTAAWTLEESSGEEVGSVVCIISEKKEVRKEKRRYMRKRQKETGEVRKERWKQESRKGKDEVQAEEDPGKELSKERRRQGSKEQS